MSDTLSFIGSPHGDDFLQGHALTVRCRNILHRGWSTISTVYPKARARVVYRAYSQCLVLVLSTTIQGSSTVMGLTELGGVEVIEPVQQEVVVRRHDEGSVTGLDFRGQG